MDQSINPPDLDDLLAESRDVVFSNMNCVQIGKIQKVNSDQTVEVKIQFLRRLQNGKTDKYPLLVDCPYFVLNGGGSYIDMPITKGDYCIILFNDRNIDDWWDTANVAVPRDTRKHNISDGIAVVGINPRAKAFDFDGSSMRFIGPGQSPASIVIKEDGSIDLTAPAGFNIIADTEITGKLTVSGIIKSLVDIIADYAATAISLLEHYHIGNLGRQTTPPQMTGGSALPASAPSMNSDGEIIDGNGTNSTEHGHPYSWTDGPGSGTTGNAS